MTLLLLVAVFGSVVAGLLPMLVGVYAMVGTLAVLRVLTSVTDVSIFSLNLTTALGLGLGHGLDAVVDRVVPSGTGATALLAVAGLGAGLANVVNNLPAYLIIEPAVADSSTRLMALLVGVNAGPLVTPWASLATLLWLARCRSVGVAIPWRWLVPAGAACALLSVAAGTVALAFVT